MRFLNYYVHCATQWTDEWDCMCNDQCPECHTKDIEPYQSKEITTTVGVSYVVTPQNVRALCWMIAHTTPSQRPQHTIAHLDSGSLRAFCQAAELAKLTVEDNTHAQRNRITLIPGQPVLARFSGPHVDEIKALFETDTIPTPFDSRHPRPDVLSAIQRQNPTATVEWESTRIEPRI
jgi:hypothetical protein